MKKVILIATLVILSGCIGVPKPDLDVFAKCITENGATMYGASWCGHCKSQKELFGESFKYVDYVECTENEQECRMEGITGYPTWIINGKEYVGGQTIEKLSQITDCSTI